MTLAVLKAPKPRPDRGHAFRRRAGFVVQGAICAACLVGSFAGVSWLASNPVGARPSEIITANLSGWPEIRNGIPEVRPEAPPVAPKPAVSALVPTAPASAALPPTPITPALAAPEPVAATSSVSNAAIRPALDGAPLDPATPSPSPPAPELGMAPKPKREPVPSAEPATTRQKAPERAARPKVERPQEAKQKPPPTAARKQVAGVATGPIVGAEASDPTPAREEEGVSVLGVPLPSGRKIKECLLELRC